MFKLENTKKLKTTLLSVSLSALLATAAFGAGGAVDGGMKYPIKDGKYGPYSVNTQDTKGYDLGRAATKDEIAAWDKDVHFDYDGLPEFDMKHGKVVLGDDGKPKKAEGSVEKGAELYDAQCVMCHGDFGSGGKGYPTLAGGSKASLTIQRLNPADERPNPDAPRKSIGSYWPYASTLFWYIQDSMPFPHPKSLTNSETYALTAYLLSINEITYEGEALDDEFVLDKEKLSKIKMPNEDGFYPEVYTPKDPTQGVKNMTALLADPKIYGTGTRCMKDCIKEDTNKLLMKINVDLTINASQPVSTVRDLPKVDASSVKPGQAEYEAKCSACHGNEAIGAPVVGNKEAWAKVTQKGIDAVYNNALNGVNAMPPKGGHMDTSDEEIKKIVDYMIDSSK